MDAVLLERMRKEPMRGQRVLLLRAQVDGSKMLVITAPSTG
jgi:hypothetical protein